MTVLTVLGWHDPGPEHWQSIWPEGERLLREFAAGVASASWRIAS